MTEEFEMRWVNVALLLVSCAFLIQDEPAAPANPNQQLMDQAAAQQAAQAEAVAQMEAAARESYRKILVEEIEYLDGVFGLTTQQKGRLETAIKGAVKRYELSLRQPRLMLTDNSGFPVYVRGEHRALGNDASRVFLPLETIWSKAVASTLSPEQAKQFKTEQTARLEFRREARIASIVSRFDLRLRFTQEQRQKFKSLVESEFGKDIGNTWGDHRVLSYFECQILKLDPKQFESILTEEQQAAFETIAGSNWWSGDDWPNGGGFNGGGFNGWGGGGFGGGGMGGGGAGGGGFF